MNRSFRDRTDAGQQLAERLLSYADKQEVIVLGLPRGGVPVAYEVAARLHAPLDIFLVRKLGLPGWEELAMGAIASGGVRVLNPSVVAQLDNQAAMLDAVTRREMAELERRERKFRKGRPALELEHCVVIVVDDGLATGATMRAAIAALKQYEASRIVVAVPVGAPEVCQRIASEVDELVCLLVPEDFHAVGQFYDDFSQTSDDEVCELLERSAEPAAHS